MFSRKLWENGIKIYKHSYFSYHFLFDYIFDTNKGIVDFALIDGKLKRIIYNKRDGCCLSQRIYSFLNAHICKLVNICLS